VGTKEEIRERLLRPLTEEEAQALRLVTPEQIRAALQKAEREWPLTMKLTPGVTGWGIPYKGNQA
jgi:hypothetical protein